MGLIRCIFHEVWVKYQIREMGLVRLLVLKRKLKIMNSVSVVL